MVAGGVGGIGGGAGMIVPGAPAPAAPVPAALAPVAHGIKVGGYAIYNLLRACLPDLPAVGIASGVAVGIGSAGAATVIGAGVGAFAGLATGIIRHTINTISQGGLRRELFPDMLESMLFRGLYRSAISNPLPLKGGAVTVEPFSQVIGNFYRNLCQPGNGMANTGVCAALSREWMSELINNNANPALMRNYIQTLKGIQPNAPQPNYVATQRQTGGNSQQLDGLYPQPAPIPGQGLAGAVQSSRTFAGNIANALLGALPAAPGNGQNGLPIFADIHMTSYFPADHATCLAMSQNANGNVDIDYFDANFGQFRISCLPGLAVNQFTEFFTDFMARTSYSVGFSSFDFRLMQ